MNYEGKTADAYLGDNPQLQALYKSYGDGIWAAVEASNASETERLVKGNWSSIILNSLSLIRKFRFYQSRL